MSFLKANMVEVELGAGSISRSFVGCLLGEGDDSADKIGVRIMSDGEPVDMTGASCVGYFIRSDGVTLVINGGTENGSAYVILPAAAYAKEGNFTLAIKVSGSGFSDTLRIVDGTVVNTTSGAVSDPSAVIPSLEDLLAVISQAEEAAEEIGAYSIAATLITGTRYKITVTTST